MTNPRTIDRRDVAHQTNPAEPVVRSGPAWKDAAPAEQKKDNFRHMDQRPRKIAR